jgi:hypothetical protein
VVVVGAAAVVVLRGGGDDPPPLLPSPIDPGDPLAPIEGLPTEDEAREIAVDTLEATGADLAGAASPTTARSFRDRPTEHRSTPRSRPSALRPR